MNAYLLRSTRLRSHAGPCSHPICTHPATHTATLVVGGGTCTTFLCDGHLRWWR